MCELMLAFDHLMYFSGYINTISTGPSVNNVMLTTKGLRVIKQTLK